MKYSSSLSGCPQPSSLYWFLQSQLLAENIRPSFRARPDHFGQKSGLDQRQPSTKQADKWFYTWFQGWLWIRQPRDKAALEIAAIFQWNKSSPRSLINPITQRLWKHDIRVWLRTVRVNPYPIRCVNTSNHWHSAFSPADLRNRQLHKLFWCTLNVYMIGIFFFMRPLPTIWKI